jgi:hypothetical protein
VIWSLSSTALSAQWPMILEAPLLHTGVNATRPFDTSREISYSASATEHAALATVVTPAVPWLLLLLLLFLLLLPPLLLLLESL